MMCSTDACVIVTSSVFDVRVLSSIIFSMVTIWPLCNTLYMGEEHQWRSNSWSFGHSLVAPDPAVRTFLRVACEGPSFLNLPTTSGKYLLYSLLSLWQIRRRTIYDSIVWRHSDITNLPRLASSKR